MRLSKRCSLLVATKRDACTNLLISYFRKYIDIDIVDDEDYQKNEVFYVELGEPIPENIGENTSLS